MSVKTNDMTLFNSLTRRKEPFRPLKEGQVGMYVCGPTVYDFFHIGNARPFVLFDTLRRYMEYLGYKVTYVQNLTDIDDKMIRRANEEGITVKELGDRFIAEYYKDADALRVKRATHHPRATEYIAAIIDIIEKLIKKGHAYVAPDNSVYFHTPSFPAYGAMTGQSREDLMKGARVDVDEIKQDATDFALWKAAKPNEPSWDSPWGQGRPGWHIECSAMSTVLLGESFDIHAGGKDLLFPHHTNEIAQSEGASGKPYVNYWLHNGFLDIDNQKMSKSLGNFFTVRDILKTYKPEVLRYFLLSAQYRSPLNFSKDMMAQAESSLSRLTKAVGQLRFLLENAPDSVDSEQTQKDAAVLSDLSEHVKGFHAAMQDDLNTAQALGSLFEMVSLTNSRVDDKTGKDTVQKALQIIEEPMTILDLLPDETEGIPEAVQKLLDERDSARKNRDWAASDRLRDEIAALGYKVEDTKQGQKLNKI